MLLKTIHVLQDFTEENHNGLKINTELQYFYFLGIKVVFYRKREMLRETGKNLLDATEEYHTYRATVLNCSTLIS